MQKEKGHVVKVFLPASLHHAMRVILVSRRQTWEEWVISLAKDTIHDAEWRKGHSVTDRR